MNHFHNSGYQYLWFGILYTNFGCKIEISRHFSVLRPKYENFNQKFQMAFSPNFPIQFFKFSFFVVTHTYCDPCIPSDLLSHDPPKLTPRGRCALFWSRHFFGQDTLLVKTLCWSRHFLGQDTFFVKTLFLVKTPFLVKTLYWSRHFFGQDTSLVKTLFWSRHFFC